MTYVQLFLRIHTHPRRHRHIRLKRPLRLLHLPKRLSIEPQPRRRAARLYRIHLAYQLESPFPSFLMTTRGARLRQQIRAATYKYIDEEAPAQYRALLRPDYESPAASAASTPTPTSPRLPARAHHAPRPRPHHRHRPAPRRDRRRPHLPRRRRRLCGRLPHAGSGSIGSTRAARRRRSIRDVWDAAGGAEAYMGTVVAGFPNFFVLYGRANAATGQHSVIFHSECQINYAWRVLRPVLTRDVAESVVVREEAQKRDVAWVQGGLEGLVFNAGCRSWWMDPVTGKNTFIYPDPMWKYWLRTIFPRWSDSEVRRGPGSGEGVVKGGLVGLAVAVGVVAVAITLQQKMSWASPYVEF